MTSNELREMSTEQLEVELKQARQSLFNLRVKSQTDTLTAPSEIRRQRRLIARILTIQREQELGSAAKAKPTTKSTTTTSTEQAHG